MDVKNQKGDVLATIEAESLAGADLYKKELPEANLEGQDLTRTRFYGANLKSANFKKATLKKADLQIADLTGANLAGANLTYAHLLGTNLAGADLTGADLKWAVFKGTKYNSQTKFPQGFAPKDHEMILQN